MTAESSVSSEKVCSVPMDLASCSGSTSRSSSPLAISQMSRPPCPKTPSRSSTRDRAICPMVRNPICWRRASVFGPTPHSREMGSGSRKARSCPGATVTQPSGFPRSEPTLARNLLGASPIEATSPSSERIRVFRVRPISFRRPEQALAGRDIQERLIDREGLHQVRILPQDGEDASRHLGVSVPPRPDEDSGGTEPVGAADRHGRADPEGPRLVGAGRHHPTPRAALGVGPDHHRLPPIGGMVELLHGRIEGVHVEVDDGTDSSHRTVLDALAVPCVTGRRRCLTPARSPRPPPRSHPQVGGICPPHDGIARRRRQEENENHS